VSDIPVGSPPVPPGRHAAPSGWYPDPANPAQERYWDGWQWSRNTRSVEQPPGHGQAGASQRWPQSPQPQQFSPQQSQPYYPYPPQGGYSAPVPAPGSRGSQAVVTADGVPLAGWWWRALAAVVDWLCVSLVAALISIPIYLRLFDQLSEFVSQAVRAGQAGLPAPAPPEVTDLISLNDQMWLMVIGMVVGMVYHSVFLRLRSATPGKLLCGLRVVPVDHGRHVGRLGWSAVLVRAAIWVGPAALSYLLLVQVVDALLPLWHPRRQALHDLAAKTQVVKIR
jgi:uncharacterized RDD family membrane protein YckC